MPLDNNTVLADPYAAISVVRAAMPNIVGTVITDADAHHVAMEMCLAPSLEFKPHGYPVEWVRIVVRRGTNPPAAYPLRAGLTWYHRYPTIKGERVSGKLCLWYPRDPEHLKWTWADGFEQFIMLVHKHLLGEEYFRRHGEWPWVDAPHSERADGRPHPVPGRLMSA